jgi:hypothetical protein
LTCCPHDRKYILTGGWRVDCAFFHQRNQLGKMSGGNVGFTDGFQLLWHPEQFAPLLEQLLW